MRSVCARTTTVAGLLVILAVLILAFTAPTALACPICGQPTITLPERLARADVALLVEWVSAQPAKDTLAESTTYEVAQVHRDGTGKYKIGETITVAQFTAGKAGNLFFLMGQKDDKLGVKWEIGPALAVTETSYQYIIQAPSPETPAEKRLAYFIKFLEFPDVAIANDAFAQFVNAPTKDIVSVAGKLPREKIKTWLADPKTPVTRQSGYGLMLGLCGGTDEARFLERRIANIDPERQTGLEGVMFGYLLLAGESGLESLEKDYLGNPHAPEGKAYPAYLATRYFWFFGNEKIGRPRLQEAMRRLLEQPTYTDLAIITLAEWKDWSLHDRLMQLYGSKSGVEASTKKTIIKYMIASTKDVAKDANVAPAHVAAGRKCLEELRQRDPRLVAETEKFFYLN